MTDDDAGGSDPPRHASTPLEELDPDLTVGVEYIGDGEPEAALAMIHDPESRPISDESAEMPLREALEIADEFCIDCFTQASLFSNLLVRNVDGQRHLHIRVRPDENGMVLSHGLLEHDPEGGIEYELVLTDPADLHQLTQPEHLELLRLLAKHDPASIRETARLVDRDPDQVRQELKTLAELKLLVFEPGEAGQWPVGRYDRLTIHLPLATAEMPTNNSSG